MSVAHVFLFFALLTYTLGLYLTKKEGSALTDSGVYSEVDPSMKNQEKELRALTARHVPQPTVAPVTEYYITKVKLTPSTEKSTTWGRKTEWAHRGGSIIH